MSGVIFEDFIRPLAKKPIPEARASLILKINTVVLGAITLILAFVVDKLSGIIQVIFLIQIQFNNQMIISFWIVFRLQEA